MIRIQLIKNAAAIFYAVWFNKLNLSNRCIIGVSSKPTCVYIQNYSRPVKTTLCYK